MRSTAGIVAGFLFIGLAANCGGDDSSGTNNTAGTTSVVAGQGGENTGATSNGGTSSAGKSSLPSAGEGGGPAPTGCTKDADCGANATCVDAACKKNDGEACEASADCLHSCVDKVCVPGADDGADCVVDSDCAHTCIDNVCAPASELGGDCDVALGAGGAGGAGAGGNGSVNASGGVGGDNGVVPQNPDCVAPLQCVSGKCLTPDGEACKDNVDCIDTCVKNLCAPKGGLDGACDDDTDCIEFDGGKLICDPNKHVCKLDISSPCQDGKQCQSNRCICSDADCTVRTCKTPDSVCQCKWSPANSESCDNGSANLTKTTQDPNGCTGANFCNAGQCVPNDGGACTIQCVYHAAVDNGNGNTTPAYCTSNGPTTCKAGYHGEAGGDCTIQKLTTTCSASCTCTLN
ncbi:MAG TPA: hypothetical protein VHB79_39570 [Polyangiaceae bacterium]|nr:hypothetical protein [Polyangiaceae bacterium]